MRPAQSHALVSRGFWAFSGGLLVALVAAPLVAKAPVVIPTCAEPVKPQLFLSPMGEPFRPIEGKADEPARRWFDQADRDHDGTLTEAEMMLDADRFFGLLDKDKNGELWPDEVHAYEQDVAPEIRLYQRRPETPADRGEKAPKKKKKGPDLGLDGVAGAGRYSFLNIPNPVASADDDVNRAVDRREFRSAAGVRFRALDPDQAKAIGFDRLPRTPAQIAANAACVQRLRDAAKESRR